MDAHSKAADALLTVALEAARAGAGVVRDAAPRVRSIEWKTKNPADAKVFLEWIGSEEFANILGNELPGFFPLSNASVTLNDDVAQTFVNWRKECKSTIRNSYQILSRGTPNLENEMWNVSAQVINGTMTPDAAAKQLQDGLAKWYAPQQK